MYIYAFTAVIILIRSFQLPPGDLSVPGAKLRQPGGIPLHLLHLRRCQVKKKTSTKRTIDSTIPLAPVQSDDENLHRQVTCLNGFIGQINRITTATTIVGTTTSTTTKRQKQ